MKGAPERIFERATTIFVNGQELEKTEKWETQFNDAYVALGCLGERVLGFADLYLPVDQFPQGKSEGDGCGGGNGGFRAIPGPRLVAVGAAIEGRVGSRCGGVVRLVRAMVGVLRNVVSGDVI